MLPSCGAVGAQPIEAILPLAKPHPALQRLQGGERLRVAPGAAGLLDAGKLRRETGWAPSYSLDQTLADTLMAWRQAQEA